MARACPSLPEQKLMPPEQPVQDRSDAGIDKAREFRLILLGSMVFVAGSMLGYISPIYLAFVSEQIPLNPRQLGMLASANYFAVGIASLSGPFWAARYATKRWFLRAGLLTCIVGNALSCLATDFATLFAVRLITGLFGSGILSIAGLMIITSTQNVHRSLGIGITASVAAAALVIYHATALTAMLPMVGPVAPIIAAATIALPLARWVSLAENKAAQPMRDGAAGAGNHSNGIITALVAQCLWAAGPGAFWSFAQHIAAERGISADTLEIVLSVGLLGGLLGSMAPVFQGERWGQLRPMATGTLAIALAAAAYQSAGGLFAMAASMSVFYVAWNYSMVYQMGFLTSLDSAGRFISILPATQVFGYSLGPIVAGLVVGEVGNVGALISLTMFVSIGIVLQVWSFVRSRHPAHSRA